MIRVEYPSVELASKSTHMADLLNVSKISRFRSYNTELHGLYSELFHYFLEIQYFYCLAIKFFQKIVKSYLLCFRRPIDGERIVHALGKAWHVEVWMTMIKFRLK